MAFPRLARFFGGRRGRLRFVLVVGAVEAATVLLFVVLFTYPGPAAPTGTVTGITLEFAGQGEASNGTGGWFGNESQSFNSPADGFPFAYAQGATFGYALSLVNADANNHTLTAATVAAPFTLVGTDPALPAVIGGYDDATLFVTLGTPHAGGAHEVVVTLSVR
jgi:hypothetical protein